MATIQVQKHKKRKATEPVPKEFVEDCKDLEPDFEKTRPKVQRIYDKWIEKGKKPKTVGSWLRDQLRQWYSPEGMWKLIPSEAHRSYQKNKSQHDAHQFLQSKNTVTGSTQESQKETKKIGSVRKETSKTHEPGTHGKWNQDPLEYNIEQIEVYDIDYLREAVKALHKLRMDFIQEAFKWQARYDEMQREKRMLIQKLEEHGIKI